MAYDYVQQQTSLKNQIVYNSLINLGTDYPNDNL